MDIVVHANIHQYLPTTILLSHHTGAKEFKAKYEEAMDVNEKLLANDEAIAAAEAKPDETEALADKVKESVKVEDKE